MTENHWAIFALIDIKTALNDDLCDVATCHINDAIDALLSREGLGCEFRDPNAEEPSVPVGCLLSLQ